MFAQDGAVIIDEHFDGASMPEDWTTFGEGTGNWCISNTSNAGGTENEVNLRHDTPTFNGTTRLAAPAMNLNGVNSIIVQFKFHFENYLGTHKLGVATSKDGGVTWHQAWQEGFSSNGVYTVDELLSTPDMNNGNVLVAIYYTGNSEFFYNLYFDDIRIIALKNNDASLNEINVLDKLPMRGNEISFTLTNSGHDVINSIEAQYHFDDEEIVTETFQTHLESLESQTLTFSKKKNLNPDANTCHVEITKVNGVPDDDQTNNHLDKNVFIGYGSTPRTVMIEHFSSCTCPHCPNADAVMATLTASNPGKFAYVKYEMNWPGPGDPYYTEDGQAMRDYYNVTGIPDLFFDSKDIYFIDVSQENFDSLYASCAFADIKGSFTMSGSVINIVIDVTSHFNMDGCKLMVSVNEKTTTENVREEFHHVMMKMLPDANGTDLTLNPMETKHFEFSHDMSGTFVEELDDLEVAAWIHKRDTKEIINSHFLYENVTGINPARNIQMTDNQDSTITVSWESPNSGSPDGYDLHINGEKFLNNSSETSYTFDSEADTYYIAEVTARYGNNVSVKEISDLYIPMATDENSTPSINIHPNPFDNQFVINGNDIVEVSIFNISGQIVLEKKYYSASDVTISTESFNPGVYIVKVSTKKGETNKKIIKKQ